MRLIESGTAAVFSAPWGRLPVRCYPVRSLAPRKLFGGNRAVGASAPVSGLGNTGNPYEELGVTTVINAEGTMTMLGGSLPHPELEAVMTMAGRHFVSIPELEVGCG